MENVKKATKGMMTRRQKRNIYYFCIMALPILQFIIFYIYVNLESISMAFSKYTVALGGYKQTLTLENFAEAFKLLQRRPALFKNSFILFTVQVFISYPLALFFSNYIYKKWPASGFFKTILFMPQLISGLVYGIIFSFLVTDCYKFVFNDKLTLLDVNRENIARTTVIIFNVLMGFGVNVLLFSGSMSNINVSVVESAHLDGANNFQEFIYITFPSIYSTFAQLFVVTLSGIFTNQMGLMALYQGKDNALSTIGYYLYLQTLWSPGLTGDVGQILFPVLSAMGLMITVIVVPVTLTVRKLLAKYGPSDH